MHMQVYMWEVTWNFISVQDDDVVPNHQPGDAELLEEESERPAEVRPNSQKEAINMLHIDQYLLLIIIIAQEPHRDYINDFYY